MKYLKIFIPVVALFGLGIILLNACKPVQNLTATPQPWSGDNFVSIEAIKPDPGKKNVFIVADYKLTELFDMLAPFYLFNATGEANVYIVGKNNTPVLIKRDLFVAPQLTFNSVDSLHMEADVIVIPALSIRDVQQDTAVIAWIKKHYKTGTKLLTVCDGASTGAATGLFDGKSITCHASDFAGIKAQFKKAGWVQNISVAKSGDLYSTAGVSNAVEGSLMVIQDLWGLESMLQVLKEIKYPHADIKLTHQSIAVKGRDKFTAASKILFKKNRRMGLLLDNGVNEFNMATVLDTYGRTLPASFQIFMPGKLSIVSKYGLTFIHRGSNQKEGLDELHLLMPEAFSTSNEKYFKGVNLVRYDKRDNSYLIDICLKRIAGQYGSRFENFVKVSLDYN